MSTADSAAAADATAATEPIRAACSANSATSSWRCRGPAATAPPPCSAATHAAPARSTVSSLLASCRPVHPQDRAPGPAHHRQPRRRDIGRRRRRFPSPSPRQLLQGPHARWRGVCAQGRRQSRQASRPSRLRHPSRRAQGDHRPPTRSQRKRRRTGTPAHLPPPARPHRRRSRNDPADGGSGLPAALPPIRTSQSGAAGPTISGTSPTNSGDPTGRTPNATSTTS